jgi:hypothetical protein
MIFIVSAILFAVGMLLVLRSAIAIAVSLIVIAYNLAKLAVHLVIAVLAGCLLFGQWCVNHIRGRSEPEGITITINITDSDEADDIARTIELPADAFRRLRG